MSIVDKIKNLLGFKTPTTPIPATPIPDCNIFTLDTATKDVVVFCETRCNDLHFIKYELENIRQVNFYVDVDYNSFNPRFILNQYLINKNNMRIFWDKNTEIYIEFLLKNNTHFSMLVNYTESLQIILSPKIFNIVFFKTDTEYIVRISKM
jgi:hypothetical protein